MVPRLLQPLSKARSGRFGGLGGDEITAAPAAEDAEVLTPDPDVALTRLPPVYQLACEGGPLMVGWTRRRGPSLTPHR
jgi:hypothetical protein